MLYFMNIALHLTVYQSTLWYSISYYMYTTVQYTVLYVHYS